VPGSSVRVRGVEDGSTPRDLPTPNRDASTETPLVHALGMALTARRRPPDPRPVRHKLPISGPLDLEATFTCGQAFRWRREPDGVWTGIVGKVELRVLGVESGILRLETAGPIDAAHLRHYFRLDENPEGHVDGARELRAIPGFVPLLGLRLSARIRGKPSRRSSAPPRRTSARSAPTSRRSRRGTGRRSRAPSGARFPIRSPSRGRESRISGARASAFALPICSAPRGASRRIRTRSGRGSARRRSRRRGTS
jgi:hypothetical protein